MSAATMHAYPPHPRSRPPGAQRPLALLAAAKTAATPPPLDRARAGQISASDAIRASVHRRRAIVVTAARPTAYA